MASNDGPFVNKISNIMMSGRRRVILAGNDRARHQAGQALEGGRQALEGWARNAGTNDQARPPVPAGTGGRARFS